MSIGKGQQQEEKEKKRISLDFKKRMSFFHTKMQSFLHKSREILQISLPLAITKTHSGAPGAESQNTANTFCSTRTRNTVECSSLLHLERAQLLEPRLILLQVQRHQGLTFYFPTSNLSLMSHFYSMVQLDLTLKLETIVLYSL